MASKTKRVTKRVPRKIAAKQTVCEPVGPGNAFPITGEDYRLAAYGHPDGPDIEFVGLDG